MNKKNLNLAIATKLIFAILGIICFVAGIPIIIISAKNSTVGLIAGIIMVVFGFYGTPMLWISYANTKSCKKVLNVIREENLRTNEEISLHLGITPIQAKEYISYLIANGYLFGMIYDGNKLSTNENNIKIQNEKTTKCPNCGGNLTKTANGKVCKYCGTSFENK